MSDDLTREERPIVSLGEWLNWRQGDITASRVSALFDQHAFITREQLADIMRGSTSSGSGAAIPDSPAMRRGRILEPAVAAAVAEEHPTWKLTKASSYHRLSEHRLGCTPDYWVEPDGLIQCKTVSPQAWEQWHGKPPLSYTLQTLCELLVTGRAWGTLAVLITNPSYSLHTWSIPRHAAAEGRILDAVAAWWKAWDAGDIPGPAPSDALAADLDDGSYRDLSADNELPALLEERSTLKTITSKSEKRLGEIDTVIKDRLGPASTAWLPGWELSYRASERAEFTVAAKTVRTLRIKATKGDAEEDTNAAD